MPKDIRFESFKYHFLKAVLHDVPADSAHHETLTDHLAFDREGPGVCVSLPATDWCTESVALVFDFKDFTFYQKGDTERAIERQHRTPLTEQADAVLGGNAEVMSQALQKFMGAAGMCPASGALSGDSLAMSKSVEEQFHDEWADGEDLESVDVLGANEALTAPEMRYIHQRLGDTTGKTLLDVGCGLGEASVYFALQGATVTATDLSTGMLRATEALAKIHGTTLKTHQASAEGMGFPEGAQFDVIYTGNLLHHVDVEATLIELDKYLKPGGTLVAWDPLAYNPVINVYRAMATDVRTPDEHPLKWEDLKLFDTHFERVERKYFWLTTLLIFIMMAIIQRRDPNKERYWKSVIQESDRWAWIFNPMSRVDRFLLKWIPPLRMLCWNVVVFAHKRV